MFDCEHGKPIVCPECGAPKRETITYAMAEEMFKIPAQTIRAWWRNHKGLEEIHGQQASIYLDDLKKVVSEGKIGRGPTAMKLKRKRS